jgi:hypothetical protein
MKKLILNIAPFTMLLFLVFSCSDDDENIVEVPTITSSTTSANVETTFTSIKISGNVTSDGGSPITARGVAWSTSTNPTINANKTSEVNDTFTSTISDLQPNTQYYFRVYATNNAGTEYGIERSFNTLSLAGTTWDYDVHIDGVTSWHADVTFYADGTTFYTEPDSPGIFDYDGTWEVLGNNVNVIVDTTASWFLELNGSISGNSMSGNWEFNGTQDWFAVPK